MRLTVLPPEVATRFRRARTAAAWRRDHLRDRDAERLWRAFRVGALAGIGALPEVERAAVRAGLDDAERVVPFPASP